MFYRPEDGHGLPHNPFNAVITPRPIGWISSRSADGVNNLAPYSFFSVASCNPPVQTINCARIAGAPAALECKLTKIVTLPGVSNRVAFGEVTGVHLRDDCMKDGMFDVTTFEPLARLGYRDYSRVTEVFSLARPDD